MKPEEKARENVKSKTPTLDLFVNKRLKKGIKILIH